jgi:hypothetical protein
MTEPCQRAHRIGFRAFMVRHQYKVLFASIVMGLIWVSVYRFLAASWFFSRLSLCCLHSSALSLRCLFVLFTVETLEPFSGGTGAMWS